jgi:hypothetical protein
MVNVHPFLVALRDGALKLLTDVGLALYAFFNRAGVSFLWDVVWPKLYEYRALGVAALLGLLALAPVYIVLGYAGETCCKIWKAVSRGLYVLALFAGLTIFMWSMLCIFWAEAGCPAPRTSLTDYA